MNNIRVNVHEAVIHYLLTHYIIRNHEITPKMWANNGSRQRLERPHVRHQ